ncbi:MAG TPA: diacylglycerol kinase family protein [Chloroflexota bacterium]|nr:diacylglycerol kinase family protein [Chloroflexota bacterium]
MAASAPKHSRTIVLVSSAHSGRGRQLRRAEESLRRAGLQIVDSLDISDLSRLQPWLERPVESRPIIVAAGGDGTVGGVAGRLVGTGSILGIVPLGTSNDVARSLGIPMKIEGAAQVLAGGRIGIVDVGQFQAVGGEPAYFVHAATIGVNVTFARMATQASFRQRLGHFTYLAAALLTLGKVQPFSCELRVGGDTASLRLLHLSVVNAPVFGGLLNFEVPGARIDDRRLDILAVEDIPIHQLIRAALLTLIGPKRPRRGIRTYHSREVGVHPDSPLDISLDGEVSARIPGNFSLHADALRVLRPV